MPQLMQDSCLCWVGSGATFPAPIPSGTVSRSMLSFICSLHVLYVAPCLLELNRQ